MRLELGTEYLAAIGRWQAIPTEQNLVDVRNSLQFYCKEISARYKQIVPVDVEVKFGKLPWKA